MIDRTLISELTKLFHHFQLCCIGAMPFSQDKRSGILQKTIELHLPWIFCIVAHHSIHHGSGLVLGDNHDRTQEVLQASLMFGMVSNQSMDLTQIVSNHHVKPDACHRGARRVGRRRRYGLPFSSFTCEYTRIDKFVPGAKKF